MLFIKRFFIYASLLVFSAISMTAISDISNNSKREAQVLSMLNDPTKPIFSETIENGVIKNTVVIEKKTILLQSIFIGKHKVATVNGKLFEEGDVNDGITVESIHSDYVMIRYKKNSVKALLSKKIVIDQ